MPSPDVVSKIVDLTSYVSSVAGTAAFMVGFNEKGEDNVVKLVTGRQSYISEFGSPNIQTFGRKFGQASYNAYNFLGQSGNLYYMRALPDDASFANLVLGAYRPNENSPWEASYTYVPATNANNKQELYDSCTDSTTFIPFGVFYPIGRGVDYNKLSVKVYRHSNTSRVGSYFLDILEKQDDGSEAIKESFEISFNPSDKNKNGDSIWITDILSRYSELLRFAMLKSDENYFTGYDMFYRIFDSNIGTALAYNTGSDLSGRTISVPYLYDPKQDFSQWKSLASSINSDYIVEVVDDAGHLIYGYVGDLIPQDNNGATIAIYKDEKKTTRGWNPDPKDSESLAYFNFNESVEYRIKHRMLTVEDIFSTNIALRNGSDGSLRDNKGNIVSAVATQVLSKAFKGTLKSPEDGDKLVDEMYDVESNYFTVIFDAGYPTEVKTEIVNLAKTVEFAIAFIDNGDNTKPTGINGSEISERLANNNFNTYNCSVMANYSYVYDSFTGQYIWVAPSYFMSSLIPNNDKIGEIWYNAAGFKRGSIDGVKQLRYVPKKEERDALYDKQINVISKFSQGYVFMSAVTSQTRISPMQDVNIARCVMYCNKALKDYARNYIQDANDEVTWSNVSTEINKFLADIKSRRGLYSYTVEVAATEYEKKNKTFHITVELEPMRAVETINLSFKIS